MRKILIMGSSIIPCIFLLFIGCHKINHQLEEMLALAGENRTELEKVLAHYKTTDADPEKYKAALFLIENMQGKFSYQGEKYKAFLRFVDSLSSIEQDSDNWEKAFRTYRAQNKTLVGNPEKVHDLNHIKSGFLINNIDRAFRYWRYVAPDSSEGGIAEIELYAEDGQLLEGKTVGTEAAKAEVSKEKAFDGDVLTYFQGDSLYGNWVGLDLGKSARVSRIRFLCWNDDNFIRKNELYELYYWEDGKWNSLGQQTGTDSQELVYRNVPTNALLLLSNHTKGREERIFTYENGKQVWW